ncbi:MAG: hypothetical protein GF398_08110 [Chitinivibrionales bacterium]|nr:hypothetical protein [Chitinivibrionales bacterium]
MLKKIAALLLSAVVCHAADTSYAFDPDLVLSSPLLFNSARLFAMSGAGTALLEGVQHIYSNPAVPNARNRQDDSANLDIHAAYARDTLFENLLFPIGMSYYLEESGTVGLAYRYLKRDEANYQHEAVFNYSGRLFDKSIDQGAVDFGLNVRYARMKWETHTFEPLPQTYFVWDTASKSYEIDTITLKKTFEGISIGTLNEHKLIIDVGFYQRDVATNLDFGLTLHNLLGYVWRETSPSVKSFIDTLVYDTADTTQPLKHYRDSICYINATRKASDWLGNRHRLLTVGIAFRTAIIDDNVNLLIPADVGIMGMFDRDLKIRFTFKAGIEANFMQHYYVRFGYAASPRLIGRLDLEDDTTKLNDNIFSGGGGFRMDHFSADVYIGKESFGAALGVRL